MKKDFTLRAMLLVTLFSMGGLVANSQTTITYTFSSYYNNAETIVATDFDSNIRFTPDKGGATTVAKYYDSGTAARFYQNGGGFYLNPQNGVTITKVVIEASRTGDLYYNIDSGSDQEFSATGSTYMLSDIAAHSKLAFRTKGTTSSDRLYAISIAVTYTDGGNTTPTIIANPTSASFSAISGGSVASEDIAVTGSNLSTDIIATLSGADATQFSINPSSITQSGGDASGTITVTYTPSATAATHNATLTLTSTGASDVTVTLNGATTEPTAAPTFSPVGGTYNSAQTVTLTSTTSGAKIYYTIDNTEPTTSSALYSAPISVFTTTTIKAIAYDSNDANPSNIVSETYSITAVPTTVLQTGDIMIVTVNTGGAGHSDASKTVNTFDFVPLVNLASGTVIKFTDNAYDGIGLKNNEGTVAYTVPTGGIAAGVVVHYDGSGTGGDWEETMYGFDPATKGDNLLVYQGEESSPSFIYGIGFGIDPSWIDNAAGLTSNNSMIPSALSASDNTLVTLGVTDNLQYNKDKGTTGNAAQLLALTAEPTNWDGTNNTQVVTYPKFAPNFNVGMVVEISDDEMASIKIWSINGHIYVETELTDTKIEVYNLAGQRVVEKNATNGLNIISIHQGLFIVKIGKTVTKVFVK